jgi:ATP-dependent Lon protease
VARRVLEKPNTRATKLTTNSVKQYLGIPRYTTTPPQQRTLIGSAMGLAVTESGGLLLPVEVATMVGKGDLQVTGQLGDVMRESALAALSYIRTRANELNIDPNFQDATDLHIHLPEGAVPKDGPSAGITIATALISAITRRPVRGDVAMTGEVTLLGSVLAIGGLKEKVLAAQQANITTVIIPAENKKDLTEVPAKIRQRVNFILVDTMDQVIEVALLPPETREQQDEPLPLRLEERVPLMHDTNLRRSGMPSEQQGEKDAEGEHSNSIKPDHSPSGHDTSLPQSRIRAKQDKVD